MRFEPRRHSYADERRIEIEGEAALMGHVLWMFFS